MKKAGNTPALQASPELHVKQECQLVALFPACRAAPPAPSVRLFDLSATLATHFAEHRHVALLKEQPPVLGDRRWYDWRWRRPVFKDKTPIGL